MKDRLTELLAHKEMLFGITCRDLSATDVELMSQCGYDIVWIDLEHGPQSTSTALQLGRLATHLGMIPMVRILEMSRTHVQRLLDGGIQIVILPDVKSYSEAKRLVNLGKYPPLGKRGVSSTSAGTNFSLGNDTQHTLSKTNSSTHLMVMLESDEAYVQREAILNVNGISLATIGPQDWSVGLGLFGEEAKSYLAPKISDILKTISNAGKLATMSVSGPDEARHYYQQGVRIFFVGVDVSMKRHMLEQAITPIKGAINS
ncbi:aldolase/citrate lyase family protein [Dehalococcoidia bacterium]|jgi:4-hydroxy-2-oxoheptanedioate aldolase|nr:aldolase/citrate lyase family protein [Dehalococcoidia bacterium]